jgi:hypothetical protein
MRSPTDVLTDPRPGDRLNDPLCAADVQVTYLLVGIGGHIAKVYTELVYRNLCAHGPRSYNNQSLEAYRERYKHCEVTYVAE